MAPGKKELNSAKLDSNERALAELASNDPRDDLSLGDKEQEILALYDRVYEQQLEEALLRQEPVDVSSVDDVDAELLKAERELLEARATNSVRRKAIESVLMTEPSIQSIYATQASSIERALLPLINRRDVLSLAYENLARLNASCLENQSNAEVKNIQATSENRDLVQSLLELTSNNNKTEKQDIDDPKLKEELEALDKANKQKRAEYTTMKRIISAAIVGSGLDWASDETLLNLVLDDESTDDI